MFLVQFFSLFSSCAPNPQKLAKSAKKQEQNQNKHRLRSQFGKSHGRGCDTKRGWLVATATEARVPNWGIVVYLPFYMYTGRVSFGLLAAAQDTAPGNWPRSNVCRVYEQPAGQWSHWYEDSREVLNPNGLFRTVDISKWMCCIFPGYRSAFFIFASADEKFEISPTNIVRNWGLDEIGLKEAFSPIPFSSSDL